MIKLTHFEPNAKGNVWFNSVLALGTSGALFPVLMIMVDNASEFQ